MQNQFYQTPLKRRSSADSLRNTARETLRGRWGLAIGVFLLACLLGLQGGGLFSSDTSALTDKIEEDPNAFVDFLLVLNEHLEESDVMGAVKYVLMSVIGLDVVLIAVIAVVSSVAFSLFVGAPVTVGYHRFLLDFADKKPDTRVGTLFTAFSTHYWKSVGLSLLLGAIYTGVGLVAAVLLLGLLVLSEFLGVFTALLLGALVILLGAAVVVYLGYRYALCYYIAADYPDLALTDVLRNSAFLMKGNKIRLFCLHFSFIGWIILAALAFGIGMVVVTPYMNAATTAFYSEISGRDSAKEVEFPSIDPEDYFPQV